MNIFAKPSSKGEAFGRRAELDKSMSDWLDLRLEEREVARLGYGVAGGVFWDFRDPLLDLDKWELPYPLSQRLEQHPGFFVEREAELPGLPSDDALERARERGCFILQAGDEVVVSDVQIHPAVIKAGPFSSDLDRLAALVSMKIRRRNGAEEDGGRGWALQFGCMVAGDGRDRTLARLGNRLYWMTRGQEEVEQAADVQLINDDLHAKLGALKAAISERNGALVRDLDEVVNLAALFGYRQGNLEASHTMLPLAEAQVETLKAIQEGAEKRRANDRVEFARAHWEKYPTDAIYSVWLAFMAERGITEEQCAQRSFARTLRGVAGLIPKTSKSYKE